MQTWPPASLTFKVSELIYRSAEPVAGRHENAPQYKYCSPSIMSCCDKIVLSDNRYDGQRPAEYYVLFLIISELLGLAADFPAPFPVLFWPPLPHSPARYTGIFGGRGGAGAEQRSGRERGWSACAGCPDDE